MYLVASASLLDQLRSGSLSTFVIHEDMVVGVEMVRANGSVANAKGSLYPGQSSCSRT